MFLMPPLALPGHVVRTPMLRNAMLDRTSGGTILVKPEVLQRTGSFKLRGATNALLRLTPEQRAAGIVTYSSGNHGQAIACAAASLGAAATIVMPADAPAIKRDATAAWGAKIVTYDRMTEDREDIGQKIQAATGATLIPPYDHPDVIAGQGTLALELAADADASGPDPRYIARARRRRRADRRLRAGAGRRLSGHENLCRGAARLGRYGPLPRLRPAREPTTCKARNSATRCWPPPPAR